jgi:hypothetical protein
MTARSNKLAQAVVRLVALVAVAFFGPKFAVAWGRGYGQAHIYAPWLLMAAAFALSGAGADSAHSKRGRLTLAEWLWFLAPLGVSQLPMWRLASVSHQLARHPSAALFTTYGIYASAWIIISVVWVVGYPFENVRGPAGKRERLVWRVIVIAGAAVLCWFIAQRTAALLHGLGAAPGTAEFQALQFWMERATTLAFIFMLFRVVLPVAVAGFLDAFRAPSGPTRAESL